MADRRSPEMTRALEEVLIEILTHLGRYAQQMVVVGGMGTYLLIRDHVGPEGYIGPGIQGSGSAVGVRGGTNVSPPHPEGLEAPV